MTELALFQRALIVLGATIVGPLFVAATGIGGEGQSVNERIGEYVAVAVADGGDEQAANEQDQPANNDQQNAGDGDTKDQANGQNDTENAQRPDGYAGTKEAGTYTVKEGDTYGCIAEQYYGSYDQWSRVYELNAGWPGFDEYRLDVGAVLQMPAVSEAEALPATNLCEK